MRLLTCFLVLATLAVVNASHFNVNYTVTINGDGSNYLFNGVAGLLNLTAGAVIRFDLTAVPSNHPFFLTSTLHSYSEFANTTIEKGGVVVASPGDADHYGSILTWVVDAKFVGVDLYYECKQHAQNGFYGDIEVNAAPAVVVASSTVVVSSSSSSSSSTGAAAAVSSSSAAKAASSSTGSANGPSAFASFKVSATNTSYSFVRQATPAPVNVGEFSGANPTIKVVFGTVLTFDLSALTASHPFYISAGSDVTNPAVDAPEVLNAGIHFGPLASSVFVAAKTGTWTYFCSVHKFKGQIIVESAANALMSMNGVFVIAIAMVATLFSKSF